MQIPRIIHQTAPRFDELPADLKANVARLKRLNPGWDYRFYDNAALARHFRKWLKPSGLALIDRVDRRYGVVFADLFRYLAIFHQGGVYLDIKSGIDRPLEEILRADDHFILSHWAESFDEEFGGRGKDEASPTLPRGEFQQWHVIGRPRHPFALAAAKRALTNIARYEPERDGVGYLGTLRLAGPICYTRAIEPLLGQAPYRLVESGRVGLRYLVYPEDQHRERNALHYSKLDQPIVRPRKRA